MKQVMGGILIGIILSVIFYSLKKRVGNIVTDIRGGFLGKRLQKMVMKQKIIAIKTSTLYEGGEIGSCSVLVNDVLVARYIVHRVEYAWTDYGLRLEILAELLSKKSYQAGAVLINGKAIFQATEQEIAELLM